MFRKFKYLGIFWVVSLIFFVLAGVISGQVLEGKIVDEKGKPLADVSVQPAGYIYSEKTDIDGKFKFEFRSSVSDQKVIIFEKTKDFEVKTIIVDDLSKPLDVVLKKRDREIEVFRKCPEETKRLKLIGDYVKLAINKKNFKIKERGFAHGVSWNLKLKKNKEKSYISGIKALGDTGRYPSSFELLGSDSYELRYRSGFLDWKGKERDGTFWRFLGGGSFITEFSYSTESREVAEKFDRIFDDACM